MAEETTPPQAAAMRAPLADSSRRAAEVPA